MFSGLPGSHSDEGSTPFAHAPPVPVERRGERDELDRDVGAGDEPGSARDTACRE
jgi:hypothetical protein